MNVAHNLAPFDHIGDAAYFTGAAGRKPPSLYGGYTIKRSIKDIKKALGLDRPTFRATPLHHAYLDSVDRTKIVSRPWIPAKVYWQKRGDFFRASKRFQVSHRFKGYNGRRRKMAPYRKRRRSGYTRKVGYYGRYNRRGMTQELKFFDVEKATETLTGPGHLLLDDSINHVVEASGESNRIGRKIIIRSLEFKYDLTLLPTASGVLQVGNSVRLIVFIDKQANGASVTTTDIIKPDTYQAMPNLVNRGRFRLLCDKTHTINPRAGAGDGAANDGASTVQSYKMHRKLSLPIEFSDTTGNISTIKSNNIGVIAYVKTSGTVAIQYTSRIRFDG